MKIAILEGVGGMIPLDGRVRVEGVVVIGVGRVGVSDGSGFADGPLGGGVFSRQNVGTVSVAQMPGLIALMGHPAQGGRMARALYSKGTELDVYVLGPDNGVLRGVPPVLVLGPFRG